MRQKSNHLAAYIFYAFSLFVVYGTTIPFNFSADVFNHQVSKILWIPFFSNDGSRTSITDVTQNILLFIPIGFIGAFVFRSKSSPVRFLIVSLYAALLSTFAETLQLFTVDRNTSVTDVITNTSGAVIGYIAARFSSKVISKFFKLQLTKQIAQSHYFLPSLLLLGLTLLELLQPLDLSLSLGNIMPEFRALMANPLSMNFDLQKDPLVFTLYFIVSITLFRLVADIKFRSFTSSVVFIFLLIIAFSAECAQLIVISRTPGFGALICAFAGITTAFLSKRFFLRNQKALNVFISISLICSIVCYFGAPFQFTKHLSSPHLVPFLIDYKYTTIVNLGNVFEISILFFVTGLFLSPRLANNLVSFVLWSLVFIGVTILEFSQMWIQTRYADISDVITALIAYICGAYFSQKGFNALQNYIISSNNKSQSDGRSNE